MSNSFVEHCSRTEEKASELGQDWRMGYDPNTQRIVFSDAVSLVDFSGARILDLGCGRGDFKAYLDRNGAEYGRYTGIEGAKSLVVQGRQKYGRSIDIMRAVWPAMATKWQSASECFTATA